MKLFYAILLLPLLASAEVPNTFIDGQVARANEVNENFSALTEQIAALPSTFPSGWDGGRVSTEIDCSTDELALKAFLERANTSPNANVRATITGRCRGGFFLENQIVGLVANPGERFTLFTDESDTATAVAGTAYGGYLYLDGADIEQGPNTAHGILAYMGGNAFIYNTTVDHIEPSNIGFQSGMGALRGSTIEVAGSASISSSVHGVYLDSGAVFRIADGSDFLISAGALGVYARKGSVIADLSSTFNITGTEKAIRLYDGSVWSRDFSEGSLSLTGDVLIENSSSFIDPVPGNSPITQNSGSLTVNSSQFSAVADIGSINANRADINLTAITTVPSVVAVESKITLIPPENYTQPLSVGLTNTALEIIPLGPGVNTAGISCQGYSSIRAGSTLLLTNKETSTCE
jgi:hypothetical protein